MTITISIIALRIFMGLRFLIPGLKMVKMGKLSSNGYLKNTQGPFSFIFKKMANSHFIDNINKWLLVLIGLSLIIGIFIKVASILGAVLMITYWFSKWGKRHEGVIDENIIYIVIFVFFFVIS